MKIASIVGARPNFTKLSPLIKEISSKNNHAREILFEHKIIHTGQHYDFKLNQIFFNELGIPVPDYDLLVGSTTQPRQIAIMMERIEKVLLKERADVVLVYGDTNSTLAGALAASKLPVKIAHIEAGLRSFNPLMQEEINRILTDRCSHFLFCPTKNAADNLRKEGFSHILNEGKIPGPASSTENLHNSTFPVVINSGDIMYDAVLFGLHSAEKTSKIIEKMKIPPKRYFLATVHRAENVDDPENLENILEALNEICKKVPVILPIHPRTKKRIEEFKIKKQKYDLIRIIKPVSYYDMLLLEKNAKKILTDSGGIQKEAFLLGIPCITLRMETEWIETLSNNNNILTGTETGRIINAAFLKDSFEDQASINPVFGDGRAAARILDILSVFA